MEEKIRLEQESGGRFCCHAAASCETLRQMGFGTFFDGKARLHPLEAAYLCERGKAEAYNGKKKLDATAILKAKAKSKTPLSDQYIIFKAFRQDGRVVRFTPSSPLHWRVYARGVGREQDRPSTIVVVVDKNWKAATSSLEPMLATARALRLELAIAYVKEGKPQLVKLSKNALEA